MKKKTAAKKKPPLPTLEERLASLQGEIDAVIAKLVDERAATCPGVPRGIVSEASVTPLDTWMQDRARKA